MTHSATYLKLPQTTKIIVVKKKIQKNYSNKKLSFDFSLEFKVTQIFCFGMGFRDVGSRISGDVFLS